MIESRDIGKRSGFDMRLEIEYDPYVSLDDFDCYDDAETIAGFQSGEWCFTTLRVVASRLDIDLGDSILGGVEYGQIDNKTYIDGDSIMGDYSDYIDSLTEEAVESAENILKQLLEGK